MIGRPGTSLTDALLADPAVAPLVSDTAALRYMLRVEAAYVTARMTLGQIDDEAGKAALSRIASFEPDWDDLRAGTGRDGMPVPDLVRQLRAGQDSAIAAAIHTGLTSQDVIDTAQALCLQAVNNIFDARLPQLTTTLDDLTRRFGARPLMGYTRMQPALPIAAGDRLAAWAAPFAALRNDLARLRPLVERVQFGGPVGTAQNDADGTALMTRMSQELRLTPGHATHTNRQALVDYASWLSRVSGAAGKIGQDVALMAALGKDTIRLSGTGGSSAMPHKQNPVLAETLVTLARWNATLVGGMHQALVHEMERSGSAWTLEWLVLPQMLMTTGRSLSALAAVLSDITEIGQAPES